MGTAAFVGPRSSADHLRRVSNGASVMGLVDFTFSNSYTTGGESFDLKTLYPNLVRADPAFVQAEPRSGNRFEYDRTNKKLLAYSGASQVANATDLSAVTTRVAFWY